MEQKKNKPTLLLKVANTELLQSGKTNEHLFDIEGGSLGSNANSNWAIQDLYQTIAGVHAQIDYSDGAFLLLLLGNALFINGAEITERNQTIRLQHGDKIQVGHLVLHNRMGSTPETLIDPLITTPEQIISAHSSPLEDILNAEKHGDAPYDYLSNETSLRDDDTQARNVIDPLKAIDADAVNSLTSFYNQAPAGSLETSTLSLTDYNSNAKQDGSRMNYHFLDVPQIDTEKEASNDRRDISELHLGLAPLLKGLGVSIPVENTDEAHQILQELGETIKAAVEGLQKLQQSQHILNDKSLRAIEDNPLRLKQSYSDTMNLMFANQTCSVHLSAPAAVAESLHNINLHNQASQSATRYALSAMLDAFSPEQLLGRFAIYRHSRKKAEMDGEWSWRMYCSYFKELSSNRQSGFEKLFWEHYAQEYDRELRRLNQESQPYA